MDREALIAAVSSAHRERGGEGAVRSHPAWHDLDRAGRVEAYEAAVSMRRMEAAFGTTGTVRAVLERIRGA